MYYAQISYQDELGNGNYTIAQAGCFVTAFCNLLKSKFNTNVDPSSLNNYLKFHGLYLRDADGTLEDLSYGSISGYNGTIRVAQTGGGWPAWDAAIVKFVYKDHTGAQVTHFCAVYSAKDRTIIDSYDGNIKRSPYGDPVSWATYQIATPNVVGTWNPPFHAWAAKVTATAIVDVRAGGTTDSQGRLGNVNADGMLHPGDVFDVVGWQLSQDPYHDGRNVWLKTSRGHWVWAYNTNFFNLPGHGAGELTSTAQTAAPVAPATFVKKGYGSQAYGATQSPENPPSENEGPIEVRRVMPDPNKWMQTYRRYTTSDGIPTPLMFTAVGTHIISDLSNPSLPSGTIRNGMVAEIAGEVEKDGVIYYRTTASEDNHTWYLINKGFLVNDEDVDHLSHDTLVMNHKEKTLARAGTITGKLSRIFKRK